MSGRRRMRVKAKDVKIPKPEPKKQTKVPKIKPKAVVEPEKSEDN